MLEMFPTLVVVIWYRVSRENQSAPFRKLRYEFPRDMCVAARVPARAENRESSRARERKIEAMMLRISSDLLLHIFFFCFFFAARVRAMIKLSRLSCSAGKALDNPGFSYLAIYTGHIGSLRCPGLGRDMFTTMCKTTSRLVASIKLYKVLMKATLSNDLAA